MTGAKKAVTATKSVIEPKKVDTATKSVIEPKKEAVTTKVVTDAPSTGKELITVELVDGLTYRLLGGPVFFKGKPQTVNSNLADRLLKTGFFKVRGGTNVPNTRRNESTRS